MSDYPYTKTEFDAFGWNPMQGALPQSEIYGLDYESARDATPRWFAVSSGNGNDGVSHTFPDYYVRTADPFLAAGAALIVSFKPEYQERAAEEMQIDGEADYTISATLYDPLDDPAEESDDAGSWCDSNGAYLIIEVFPADDLSPRPCDEFGFNDRPAYNSLAECFTEGALRLAAE